MGKTETIGSSNGTASSSDSLQRNGVARCLQRSARRVAVSLALIGLLGAAGYAEAAPVDINRASAAELEALPGIGAAKAAAIIEERQTRPFASVEDLERVRGIGPALLAQLREQVTVAPSAAGSKAP
jgi:competence ComEA-like helix-hairpin-helix protein